LAEDICDAKETSPRGLPSVQVIAADSKFKHQAVFINN
jgi:hypothetical protein